MKEDEKIEKLPVEIEKETTSKICILILKNLEGKSIEDYANEIFKNWSIGKK